MYDFAGAKIGAKVLLFFDIAKLFCIFFANLFAQTRKNNYLCPHNS